VKTGKEDEMKLTTTMMAAMFLTACATTGSHYVPVVDMQGKDPERWSTDLAQCQQYATQRMEAAQGAVIGAALLAGLAAALAPGGYRNQAARQGAIIGGVAGAGNANETQQDIIKRCLWGRGYNVLN
jgi:outer membrane lipoprotein SlyB